MTSIAVDHEKTGPKEKAKKNKKQNTSSDSSPEGFPRGKKENWSGSLDVLNVVVKRESEIVSKEEVTNALSRCSSEASLNNIKHRGSISSFLPSHLRPPLIVTGLSGLIDNDSRPPSGSATDTSEDHELLELLSNMKSSPKWPNVLPNAEPYAFERKRCQDQSMHHEGRGSGRGGGGAKRMKLEGKEGREGSVEKPARRKSIDSTTPTDKALKLVRLELARREKLRKNGNCRNGENFDPSSIDLDATNYADGGVVPFDLLPFFKYLGDETQRYSSLDYFSL